MRNTWEPHVLYLDQKLVCSQMYRIYNTEFWLKLPLNHAQSDRAMDQEYDDVMLKTQGLVFMMRHQPRNGIVLPKHYDL